MAAVGRPEVAGVRRAGDETVGLREARAGAWSGGFGSFLSQSLRLRERKGEGVVVQGERLGMGGGL